jgi:GT2 family glycosyltransferase
MDMKMAVVLPILLNYDWQLAMTRCCIETLAVTTDIPFQLIVVEDLPVGRQSARDRLEKIGIPPEAWLTLPRTGNVTANINAGIDVAQNNFDATHVLYMGNDIFVRPYWAESLCECFERYPDCGVATLASADLTHTPLAAEFGRPIIREGVYGPFMMFSTRWRFDADRFPCAFADSDLVMRLYEQGYRSYRNNRVVIQHLNRQTLPPSDERVMMDYETSQRTFNERYASSPLLIYRVLKDGWII